MNSSSIKKITGFTYITDTPMLIKLILNTTTLYERNKKQMEMYFIFATTFLQITH